MEVREAEEPPSWARGDLAGGSGDRLAAAQRSWLREVVFSDQRGGGSLTPPPPGSAKNMYHSTTKAQTVAGGKGYYRVLSLQIAAWFDSAHSRVQISGVRPS
jgi:hypothetical protein